MPKLVQVNLNHSLPQIKDSRKEIVDRLLQPQQPKRAIEQVRAQQQMRPQEQMRAQEQIRPQAQAAQLR